MSDPWWVGDLFVHHQQIPSQMWGHFLPGKRYSPALSNHQIGNFRDSCKLPQLKAAKPDIWDPAPSYWGHPGLGMLDEFGGLTDVVIYPMCANLLWRVVVLATLIQGLIVTGWQATQLTYKQLKHTNSRYPRQPWVHAAEQTSNTYLSGYNCTHHEALR